MVRVWNERLHDICGIGIGNLEVRIRIGLNFNPIVGRHLQVSLPWYHTKIVEDDGIQFIYGLKLIPLGFILKSCMFFMILPICLFKPLWKRELDQVHNNISNSSCSYCTFDSNMVLCNIIVMASGGNCFSSDATSIRTSGENCAEESCTTQTRAFKSCILCNDFIVVAGHCSELRGQERIWSWYDIYWESWVPM